MEEPEAPIANVHFKAANWPRLLSESWPVKFQLDHCLAVALVQCGRSAAYSEQQRSCRVDGGDGAVVGYVPLGRAAVVGCGFFA